MSADSKLIFDISSLSTDKSISLLNDFSLISGKPDYSFIVSDTQVQGKYILACEASSFNGAITLQTNKGDFLGLLNLGESYNTSNASYSLSLDQGELAMDIRIAPQIILSANNTTPAQSATLTATTNTDGDIFFSIDNIQWTKYEHAINVVDNVTYYFKTTGGDGYTATNKITFSNIDRIAPDKPTASANITIPSKDDVIVTATFSEDTDKKEYSLDNQTWKIYENSVTMKENGTVHFRGTDAAGNVSEVTSYEVKTIDKVAPTAPFGLQAVVSAQTVTLSWTASTDELAGVKEYLVNYLHDGQVFSLKTTETSLVLENMDPAAWQWNVTATDKAGNVSRAALGDVFTVTEPEKKGVIKSDRDGNGVSDVMFVWTGYNYAHGYWMNGQSDWWSANAVSVSADWDNLGSYDMSGDGKADAVMFGNVTVNGNKGAYIGYYQDGDDANGWVNIGFLNNSQNITWKNKIGNLTGNASGVNSIVWYAPDLYALGVWTDSTDNWVSLSSFFGGEAWTLAGCGDFSGSGKDSVLMSFSGGAQYYAVDIEGTAKKLGSANWSGWDVRAIGDFAGDGKDDIVLFHSTLGAMALLVDGNADNYVSLGQLNANDWFVVGAGDYNGDQKDDLLVRQKSTGMLGYYSSGNTTQWVEMGRGVDMNWTVIA